MGSELKPHEVEYLKMWLMQFHDYISKHAAGLRLGGDFPSLLALYEESKPLYKRLLANTPIEFRVLVEGNDAILFVGDVPVECTVESSTAPE